MLDFALQRHSNLNFVLVWAGTSSSAFRIHKSYRYKHVFTKSKLVHRKNWLYFFLPASLLNHLNQTFINSFFFFNFSFSYYNYCCCVLHLPLLMVIFSKKQKWSCHYIWSIQMWTGMKWKDWWRGCILSF